MFIHIYIIRLFVYLFHREILIVSEEVRVEEDEEQEGRKHGKFAMSTLTFYRFSKVT